MRIGILATPSKPISTDSAGGTELFCALLADQLARRKHTVYLFATPAAHVEGVHTIEIAPYTISEIKTMYLDQTNQELESEKKNIVETLLNARLVVALKQFENKLDIAHDNTLSMLVPAVSNQYTIPILSTIHVLPAVTHPLYAQVPQLVTHPTLTYVSASQFEQKHLPLKSTMIYHGIDVDRYEASERTDQQYLLWFGRISSHTPKGLKEAVLVAKQTKQRLCFTGYVSDIVYFETEIKPRLSNYTKMIPIISGYKDKNHFIPQARATILPIQVEETFGFVFVESMACGTPVIAYARGSVPEVIKDGETGFIVNSSDTDIRGDFIIKKTGIEGLCEAVEKIYAMPDEQYRQMRQACRAHVEKNFTVEKMVDGYEKLYEQIIATH